MTGPDAIKRQPDAARGQAGSSCNPEPGARRDAVIVVMHGKPGRREFGVIGRD